MHIAKSGITGSFASLQAVLGQLADVLAALNDEQYVRQPVGVIDGSFGGHVRHCLDHCESLCRGAASGLIDYDQRERGTPVETSRTAALAAIASIERSLAALDDAALTLPLRVTTLLAGDRAAITSDSSLGRELAFVLSHTVHHYALLAAICRTLGVPTPARFGFAPSTISYLDSPACAR
ncbi:DinB superfamily protein [Phycisphaerae bacterium RAS1]|nr:DinB superfamily protein [Phycisphaerae bacterium RAS1]